METDWGMVAAAGALDCRLRNPSLETLLNRYLPVLKVYLVSQFSVGEDQASDWLQEFLLEKVVKKNFLRHADRLKGKFRTFLLRALSNFVIQQIRRDQANKRQPTRATSPLHEVPEHQLVELERRLDVVIDLAWAQSVLGQAIERMEQECEEQSRPELWAVFDQRLLRPLLENVDPIDYRELVESLHLEDVAQATNLLTTAKRAFSRHLWVVVSGYVRGEAAIEAEIQQLKSILFNA